MDLKDLLTIVAVMISIGGLSLKILLAMKDMVEQKSNKVDQKVESNTEMLKTTLSEIKQHMLIMGDKLNDNLRATDVIKTDLNHMNKEFEELKSRVNKIEDKCEKKHQA